MQADDGFGLFTRRGTDPNARCASMENSRSTGFSRNETAEAEAALRRISSAASTGSTSQGICTGMNRSGSEATHTSRCHWFHAHARQTELHVFRLRTPNRRTPRSATGNRATPTLRRDPCRPAGRSDPSSRAASLEAGGLHGPLVLRTSDNRVQSDLRILAIFELPELGAIRLGHDLRRSPCIALGIRSTKRSAGSTKWSSTEMMPGRVMGQSLLSSRPRNPPQQKSHRCSATSFGSRRSRALTISWIAETELEDEPRRVASPAAQRPDVRPGRARRRAARRTAPRRHPSGRRGSRRVAGARAPAPTLPLIATAHQTEQTHDPLTNPLDRIVVTVDQCPQEDRATACLPRAARAADRPCSRNAGRSP